MTRKTHKIKTPETGLFRVLGLMSGTSLDGIDVALLETDGGTRLKRGPFLSVPYSKAFRARLRAVLGKKKPPKAVVMELTRLHAKAVKAFLRKYRLKADDIHALGFHGHTLFHAPEKGITVQAGDGALLAKLTGIPVVWDFRTEDVKAGGQGAPLVPVYHQALAARWQKPCAFVNIGGVANITFVGACEKDLLAFDTGPGNALIDDWTLRHTGKPYDKNGKLAARGKVDIAWVERFLRQPYFRKCPPKSLDRDVFAPFVPDHLKAADGAATLTAMSAAAIAAGLKHLPAMPRLLLLCGGGRKNTTLVRMLKTLTGLPIKTVEAKNLDGDAMEAEAFAYLAVRALLGLPISFAGTTGRRC